MLKQIIRILYGPFGLLKVSIKKTFLKTKWSRYGRSLRYPLAKDRLIELDPTKVYLVLAPHSDDEWIGCSQILKTMPQSCVCYMNMPGRENDKIHTERYNEIKKGVGKAGRILYTIGYNRIESLVEIIKSIRPDIILVPFYMDWHEAHIAVMKMLKHALTESMYECNIMMYQVSVPIPKNACNVCIPMLKTDQKEKWCFFREVYKTQSFMPVKRFMAYERIEGGLSGSYSAEVYSLMPSVEWTDKLDTCILEKKVRQDIQVQLNDIPYVINKINGLYEE